MMRKNKKFRVTVVVRKEITRLVLAPTEASAVKKAKDSICANKQRIGKKDFEKWPDVIQFQA